MVRFRRGYLWLLMILMYLSSIWEFNWNSLIPVMFILLRKENRESALVAELSLCRFVKLQAKLKLQ